MALGLAGVFTPIVGQQVNALGVTGSTQNTQSVLSHANGGPNAGYNPVGQTPPVGTQGPNASGATDASGSGVHGGQSPSPATYFSGVAGSGANVSPPASCMTSTQLNPITGTSTVGKGPEGHGDSDNPCTACPCSSTSDSTTLATLEPSYSSSSSQNSMADQA
ncbi:MAG TPA: hypothetical protein VGO93_26410 [Candidatus Xenobia bacterium]|jgi:hypothetical protein